MDYVFHSFNNRIYRFDSVMSIYTETIVVMSWRDGSDLLEMMVEISWTT